MCSKNFLREKHEIFAISSSSLYFSLKAATIRSSKSSSIKRIPFIKISVIIQTAIASSSESVNTRLALPLVSLFNGMKFGLSSSSFTQLYKVLALKPVYAEICGNSHLLNPFKIPIALVTTSVY